LSIGNPDTSGGVVITRAAIYWAIGLVLPFLTARAFANVLKWGFSVVLLSYIAATQPSPLGSVNDE